jgi:hypothetical protein
MKKIIKLFIPLIFILILVSCNDEIIINQSLKVKNLDENISDEAFENIKSYSFSVEKNNEIYSATTIKKTDEYTYAFTSINIFDNSLINYFFHTSDIKCRFYDKTFYATMLSYDTLSNLAFIKFRNIDGLNAPRIIDNENLKGDILYTYSLSSLKGDSFILGKGLLSGFNKIEMWTDSQTIINLCEGGGIYNSLGDLVGIISNKKGLLEENLYASGFTKGINIEYINHMLDKFIYTQGLIKVDNFPLNLVIEYKEIYGRTYFLEIQTNYLKKLYKGDLIYSINDYIIKDTYDFKYFSAIGEENTLFKVLRFNEDIKNYELVEVLV